MREPFRRTTNCGWQGKYRLETARACKGDNRVAVALLRGDGLDRIAVRRRMSARPFVLGGVVAIVKADVGCVVCSLSMVILSYPDGRVTYQSLNRISRDTSSPRTWGRCSRRGTSRCMSDSNKRYHCDAVNFQCVNGVA